MTGRDAGHKGSSFHYLGATTEATEGKFVSIRYKTEQIKGPNTNDLLVPELVSAWTV